MPRATTFTSYVNMEPAKGVDAALSTLERKANSTFARIGQQASRVSASTATGRPAQGAQGLQNLAAGERRHAEALRATVTAQNAAAAASARLTGKHLLESNAARAAAASTTALERSLRLASVAANVAQGPLGPLAGRLSAVATAVRELSGVRLGLVGAGAAAAGFVRYASAAQDLKSKLFPLFDSQSQVNAAFKDTLRIANAARLSLEPVVDLYAKLTLGGRDVGLSQQRIASLTETAAKAAKLSGGSSISQDAGLYQFAQGIGSGNLGGDELKSVRENTLRLAKAIADGLGVTIAELKALGKEGKLTATVIADALETQRGRIDAELAKLPPTISSATAKLNNAFTELVNGTDETYAITAGVATVMNLLAENLGLVTRAVAALVIGYAAMKTVDTVRDTFRRIEAFQQERRELIASRNEALRVAREGQATAALTRRSSAERIVALRAERAQIRQQIIAEQQLAAKTRATRNELTQRTSRGSYAGRALDLIALKNATDVAGQAERRLAVTQNYSRQVSLDLHRETGRLTGAKQAYRSATASATAAAATFGRGMRGLLAAINPLGIAIAIGINLLIEFAFREDAAANSGDRMAESQNRLARFINFTTGKLIEQNQALVNNEILTNRKNAATAQANYLEARANLSKRANSVAATNRAIFSEDPRIKSIVAQYETRQLTAPQASAALEKLGSSNPSLRARVDPYISQFGGVVSLAREAEQARASAAALAGNRDPETIRRAQGNFTGSDADLTGSTAAGAAAADKAEKADQKLAGSRKDRADATEKAAEAERRLNEQIERRTDKRTDVLSRYDEEPTALDRAARDARELSQLVGEQINGIASVTKDNPLGRGIYTQEMADADKARIDFGVKKPIRDLIEEQRRGLEVSQLRLEGYELEANVLERALAIQETIGEVERQDLDTLIQQERQQLRINDALESRGRQVSLILDTANQTRDAFESMLLGLRRNPLQAIKNFGNTLIDNVLRIEARKITEKIFAGADEKLRDLVSGSNGVDRAAEILEANARKHSGSVSKLTTANDNLATATEYTAGRIRSAGDSVGGIPGLAPSTTLSSTLAGEAGSKISSTVSAALGVAGGTISQGSGLFSALLATGSSVAAALAGSGQGANDNSAASEGFADIQVVATKLRDLVDGRVPSGSKSLGVVLEKGLKELSEITGIKLPKKLGEKLGKALQGAGIGLVVHDVLGALGIKQSKTGAAIGGAIGGAFAGPLGALAGAVIGGTIGQLLKKAKTGSASVSVGADGFALAGAASGSSPSFRKDATGLAGQVGDQLNQIAEALNAELGGALGVSIGRRGKKFVVDTTGANRTKGAGVFKFKTEEEAIAFAIEDAIKDGVITGISAASQRILQSGQDLQRALNKAIAIESIPRRLLQLTDPVRFAVEELNTEFTKLIAYLNEGGASAAQFAEAQQLYDLERARAIEQATQQSVAALQGFLDEMLGGASSPFNKRTVYENAAAKLASFRGDIDAGRAVDQNDLLNAAKNFQDASRALYGSSQSFFTDFNDLFALITRARDNVGGTVPGTLPGSPFDTAAVQAALQAQTAATIDQTGTLAARLDAIHDALVNGGFSVPYQSTLNYLPFANVA